MRKLLLLACVLVLSTGSLLSQTYDLLLKGGHVIDPKNKIDGVMDVAIKENKIARIAANIPGRCRKS